VALAEAVRRKPLVGTPQPRVAPPRPARTNIAKFRDLSAKLGLDLFPWQETAARYLTATNAQGNPLYREVAIIVARRNGKTTLLLPLIVSRMLEGQQITHAAQQLRLPDEMFRQVVDVFERHYPGLIPKKRGISWRAGQEEIRIETEHGQGRYRPIAANNGAARGLTNDVVIIDELREMTDLGVLSALKPTTAQSPNRQMIYLSNAGTADSLALKSIQARAGLDAALAYLEWSAAPDLKPDDMAGWLVANPAIGHNPAILESLEEDYRAALLGGTMAEFEVERLCREQLSLKPPLVQPDDWAAQDRTVVARPSSPVMAVKMDIGGERASAVVAWRLADQRVAVVPVADVTGSPIDIDAFGPELVKKAQEWRVSVTGFDPYTDVDLIRYFRRNHKIIGRDYALASESFARRTLDHQFVVDDDRELIATDLARTIRKPSQYGTFIAVKADDVPNTAAEAAVRAAWLAVNKPTFLGPARVQ
jgi:hypothetical protein